jgi:hypothetical protein
MRSYQRVSRAWLTRSNRLVEETEALGIVSSCPATRLPTRMTHHVVVRLLLGLLLLLLLGGLGGGLSGTTSSGGSTTGSGGTTTTDVGQELLDVLAVEGLGEEGSPDGLDLDVGGRGKSGDLLALIVSFAQAY